MRTKKNDKNGIEWTYRDMKWSIVVLVAIIILILSLRISADQNVTNILSIGGSLVSIILGIVAILISVIQNNSSARLDGHVSTTLALINQKLESIDSQINKMEPYSKETIDASEVETQGEKITRINGIYSTNKEWGGPEFVREIKKELSLINEEYQLIDYSIIPLRIGQDNVFKFS
ncbi:hypothetical protein [Paenibacillus tundrae]|uniref:hypothetical protein n=1 Tax=Paenibacillus tundrae TaxID=528187 RepID=UPI0030CC1ABD